jgi:hypothetical protein
VYERPVMKQLNFDSASCSCYQAPSEPPPGPTDSICTSAGASGVTAKLALAAITIAADGKITVGTGDSHIVTTAPSPTGGTPLPGIPSNPLDPWLVPAPIGQC